MFDGITVKLGGKDFVLPPLSMKQLRNGLMEKIREHDKLVGEDKHFDAQLLRTEIIGAALRRNYPDLSDDDLFEWIDMRNQVNLWNITLGGSGLVEAGAKAAENPPTAAPTSTTTTSGPSTVN